MCGWSFCCQVIGIAHPQLSPSLQWISACLSPYFVIILLELQIANTLDHLGLHKVVFLSCIVQRHCYGKGYFPPRCPQDVEGVGILASFQWLFMVERFGVTVYCQYSFFACVWVCERVGNVFDVFIKKISNIGCASAQDMLDSKLNLKFDMEQKNSMAFVMGDKCNKVQEINNSPLGNGGVKVLGGGTSWRLVGNWRLGIENFLNQFTVRTDP